MKVQYLIMVICILASKMVSWADGVECSDPRCTLKGTDLIGRCVCLDWIENTDPPPASTEYINEAGDRVLVVENDEYITHYGIDLNKINENHNKLIISMSGAGVYSDAKDETDGPFETMVHGDYPSSNSDYGDGIYKFANNYLEEKTVAVIGYPWFYFNGAIEISDEYWGPGPHPFAEKIRQALDKMAENSKLILIGKSMGGCKMQQVVTELNALNVDVDLLVIVDGSCNLSDQSSQNKPIYSNVKKIFNFRQTSDWPDNDWQNGFSISFSAPTMGYDIIVTDYNSFVGETLCAGVGHNDIDECENIQKEIDRIIKNEINGDLAVIINLLLLD